MGLLFHFFFLSHLFSYIFFSLLALSPTHSQLQDDDSSPVAAIVQQLDETVHGITLAAVLVHHLINNKVKYPLETTNRQPKRCPLEWRTRLEPAAVLGPRKSVRWSSA